MALVQWCCGFCGLLFLRSLSKVASVESMSLQSNSLRTKPSIALIYTSPTRFHEEEEKTRSLLHVPDGHNPTSPGLSPYAMRILNISSLLLIDLLDAEGRPSTKQRCRAASQILQSLYASTLLE